MLGSHLVPIADPLGPGPAVYSASMVDGDGARLRLLRWRPRRAAQRPPLLFIAGWVSDVRGWIPVLERMVLDREVLYLETREKASSALDGRLDPAAFTIERQAADLLRVVAGLDLDLASTVLAGSSMGATVILEALKHGRLRVAGGFLIGPNARFQVPWWGHPLLRLPDAVYGAGKEFALWYVRRFRVDARREPEQMQRYERTVRGADPRRIRMSARAVAPYEVWPHLETIDVPVGVASAPSDTLHHAADARRIADLLPRGRYLECPSNLYMHSPDIVHDLDAFAGDL